MKPRLRGSNFSDFHTSYGARDGVNVRAIKTERNRKRSAEQYVRTRQFEISKSPTPTRLSSFSIRRRFDVVRIQYDARGGLAEPSSARLGLIAAQKRIVRMTSCRRPPSSILLLPFDVEGTACRRNGIRRIPSGQKDAEDDNVWLLSSTDGQKYEMWRCKG